MAVVVILLVIVIFVGVVVAFTITSNKISNKVHKTVMRSTGLGNALNENSDRINAKAIEKLNQLLAEGKITQEQYDKRKKNLTRNYDFNN